MDIHQMQVRYDPNADRIIWQVRTRGGELFSVWLTRRMVIRLWPPFSQLVTTASIATQVAPTTTVLPEAREMLAQAARERPLPSADFKTPFNPEPAAEPLGAEPLLPNTVDLGHGDGGKGLAIRVREANGRSLELRLNDDLATALMRLIDKALLASEWGLVTAPAEAAAAVPPARPTPSSLN
ncbi:hypothetical protein [Aquabacterium sp. OR-4]|uniref:hypothetical protein n=1 Tax=Aquabacterium sp. OR-4 TaxID=2978127 RepID=UPI0021B3206E|nr:hypothetical protein [Aquabacterium sp. OR-4]MDT7835520.1 hypothetical protein [Aquabacterium sp. OR-4]